MGESNSSASGGGTGFAGLLTIFAGLLTILVIGLKLGGVIDWSWWWVLAPIWISLGFAVLIVGVIIAVASKDDRW